MVVGERWLLFFRDGEAKKLDACELLFWVNLVDASWSPQLGGIQKDQAIFYFEMVSEIIC
jgi:hypothetical protein